MRPLLLLCLALFMAACSGSEPERPDASIPGPGIPPHVDAGEGDDDGGLPDAGTPDGGDPQDPDGGQEADGGTGCPSGYTEDNAGGCQDVDECEDAAGLCGSAHCVNVKGSHLCLPDPVAVVLQDTGTTTFVGTAAASTRWWHCPAGEALVGYNFTPILTHIASMSPYCSPITITGTDYASLTLGTQPPPPPSSARICAAGEVVVALGVKLAANDSVASVEVRCATVSAELDPVEGPVIRTGPPRALPVYPANGAAPDRTTGCSGNDVAFGTNPAGGQYTFGLNLRCARPLFHGDLPDITFSAPADTSVTGAPGGTAFTDMCQEGEVLNGLQIGSQWRSYRIKCATPVLDEAPDVRLVNSAYRGGRGDVPASNEVTCGSGAALVGLSVAISSTTLYRITLRCAPLAAESDAAGWTITVDAPMDGPHFGQLAPDTDATVDCPAGAVGVGLHSRTIKQSNDYVKLAAVGLACAEPGVP